jgi:hypothetical protein
MSKLPQASSERASDRTASAEAQLRTFIAKFDPANQKLIRAVRRNLRARFPRAFEMVYDNYNFFVIGYSPTERPSHAIVSIAAGANGVSLCFIQGAHLPDPQAILTGGGTQTRFVRIEGAASLDKTALRALLSAAEDKAPVPFATRGQGKLIIKSISARQRPRRKLS